jgi:riboflavin biosynthesis pyrimidine reductase
MSHDELSVFLKPYLATRPDGRPLTILTWAQSLDAKIAPGTRKPIALSSLETKFMTHLIRRQSDAILIGAETAVTDNPSLNGIVLGMTD